MALTSDTLPPALRKARLAILTVFFVNGATLASWVAHIPLVKERLSLSEGVLGFTLLSMAVGALVSMPLTGALIPRVGSRLITRVTTIGFCLALVLPITAPSLPVLVASLFVFGAFQGSMDVAMNAQAVAVENAYARAIMSAFHGFFSLGGLIGAGLGGVVLSLGVTPAYHALGATVVLGAVGLGALGYLVNAGDEQDAHSFALPTGPLLLLGLLAFFVLVGEGAMADWSGVYLRDVLGTSVGLAAGGYAAFSLTMTIGRFVGDRLVERFRPVELVRSSALLAAAGLGAGLLIGTPASALVGFACVGLGLSNLIPIFFGAAGRIPGVNPGTGIAAVSTAGYFGFLAGPPLIGLAAEVVTLTGALFSVVVAVGLVALLANVVNRAKPASSASQHAR